MLMRTTGTLTFHAAHNYGSMLQAFALQQYLLGLGCANEIIDLRPAAQARMYRPFSLLPAKSLPNFVQNLLDLRFKPALDRKWRRFERFLRTDLRCTRHYASYGELVRDLPACDRYITGRDQVWNVSAGDFDWSYFLPFAQGNALSYAPSFGPGSCRPAVADAKDRICACLSRFKAISVRESGSAAILKEVCGLDAEVLVDPTLLLTREEWVSRMPAMDPVRPGYILVYSPSVYTREMLRTVRRVARQTGRRVVLTNPIDGRLRFEAAGFDKVFDCGPWEFLHWLRSADLVMTTSYHAVVFSLLFERPFYAVRDYRDNRMDQLLTSTGLTDRLIASDADGWASGDPFSVDFSAVAPFLEAERRRSRAFLLKNLDLDDGTL